MGKRTVKVLAAIVVGLVLVWIIDWQTSQGSVVTRDGVTLIEDDRLGLLESKAVAGQGRNGSLAVLPGGCIGLTYEDDGSQVNLPVIWEHGTELVSGDPLRIEFGDQTYAEGVDIYGGSDGAYTAVGEGFLDQIPDSCMAKKFDRLGADD